MADKPIPSAFGVWVRERRERALLTQQDLAALAGVDARTIRDVERGWIATPRASTRRLLTGALNELECPAQPTTVKPRELPAEPFGFTGRAGELAELDDLLAHDATAAVITAVSGTAGVGKTALALAWAHRTAHRFPDGQLYLNLRGYDPEQPMPSADALAVLLRSLGVDAGKVPVDVPERAARYRSLLADRRMLILLDNASSAEQVRDLLPGTSTCFVLITSRDRLTNLGTRYGAHRIGLDLLPPPDAITLLRRLIGERVERDLDAAAALARACAYLPLALRLVAEWACTHPRTELGALADDLADEQRRLDRLDRDTRDDSHESIRTVFSWSLHHLSPGAAVLFGLLGLHPGTDFDHHAIAALSATDLEGAWQNTQELIRSGLLDDVGTERFRLHDLLRAYAAEHAPAADSNVCRQARARLYDHYLGTAAAAADAAYPEESHRRPPAPNTAHALRFSDEKQAITWLQAECTNLIAIAGDARKTGNPEHAILLSSICWRFLTNSCQHEGAITLHSHAVASARDSGNLAAEAHALNNLASAVWPLGLHREAIDHLERAADLDSGGPGEWLVLNSLAGLYWFVGRQADAVDAYARSLRVDGRLRDRPYEHFSHPNLSGLCERHGCTDEMIGHVRHAVSLAVAHQDMASESFGLTVLAGIFRLRGSLDEALDHARRAHNAAAALGYRPADNAARNELGRAYVSLGRYEDALDQLSVTLHRCRETVDRANEGYTLTLLGITHTRQSHFSDASAFLQQALTLSRTTRDRDLEAKTMNALGEWSFAQKLADQAASYYTQALHVTHVSGNRYEHARALDGLSAAHHRLGGAQQAEQCRQEALELFTALGTVESTSGQPR